MKNRITPINRVHKRVNARKNAKTDFVFDKIAPQQQQDFAAKAFSRYPSCSSTGAKSICLQSRSRDHVDRGCSQRGALITQRFGRIVFYIRKRAIVDRMGNAARCCAAFGWELHNEMASIVHFQIPDFPRHWFVEWSEICTIFSSCLRAATLSWIFFGGQAAIRYYIAIRAVQKTPTLEIEGRSSGFPWFQTR